MVILLKSLNNLHPTLTRFTDKTTIAMCTNMEVGEGGAVVTRSKKERHRAETGPLLSDMNMLHEALNGRTLGVEGTRREGQCRVCSDKHASCVCKTCSIGLGSLVARNLKISGLAILACMDNRATAPYASINSPGTASAGQNAKHCRICPENSFLPFLFFIEHPGKLKLGGSI